MKQKLSVVDKINIFGLYSRNSILFIAIAAANTLVLLVTNKYIVTMAIFQNSWQDRLNDEQITSYFQFFTRYAWLGYFALAIYLFIKYALIALVLQVASDFRSQKIPFTSLFRGVMIAELIFLFPQVLKIMHFLHHTDYTLTEFNNYEPFSLAALLHTDLTSDWNFPLRALNVWEVIYWILLADSVRQISGWKMKQSLRFVLTTYVPSLFFWLILIAFTQFIITK